MKKAIDIAVIVAPIVALALVITFVVFNILSLFSHSENVLVKKTTLYETVTLDGFVFRDEEVLTSSGSIEKTYYSDGEKIPAGAVVASDGSDITSKHSGYFYSYVDGYESIFTSDAALNLTAENFDKITAENPFDDSKNAKPKNTPGAFAKVATDFKWYFAAKTDSPEKFKSGEEYAVTFGDAVVTMTLLKKAADEKHAVLVFRCDETPRALTFSRAMTGGFEIAHSGTAVPSDAIYDIDKSKCVYIFDDGYARRRAVNLIFEQDGVCIVESKYLDDGDLVIVGKNLYDGKVMH